MERIRVLTSEGEIEFEGREVEVWEGMRDFHDPTDNFSMTIRLYECPDGYRVHETIWALSSGWENAYTLYPVVGDVGYGTYAEEEARDKWGDYFGYLQA